MTQTTMRAITRTLLLTAAVASVSVLAAPKAEAGIWTFDFAAWANGNPPGPASTREGPYSAYPLAVGNSGAPDGGVVDPLLAAAFGSDDPGAPGTGSYTNANGSSPASGFGSSRATAPFAYLDAYSGGSPGGLGVCSTSGSAGCEGNDDDNINYGEILTLAFIDNNGTGIQISDLQIAPSKYQNGDHNPFTGQIMIDIDGGGFSNYNVVNGALTQKLNGSTFSFKTASSTYSTTSSFYISFAEVRTGGDKTNLPEPAALGLFGLGLAGVGIAVRRRRVK